MDVINYVIILGVVNTFTLLMVTFLFLRASIYSDPRYSIGSDTELPLVGVETRRFNIVTWVMDHRPLLTAYTLVSKVDNKWVLHSQSVVEVVWADSLSALFVTVDLQNEVFIQIQVALVGSPCIKNYSAEDRATIVRYVLDEDIWTELGLHTHDYTLVDLRAVIPSQMEYTHLKMERAAILDLLTKHADQLYDAKTTEVT